MPFILSRWWRTGSRPANSIRNSGENDAFCIRFGLLSLHRSDVTIFNKSPTATACTCFDSGNVSLPACTTIRDLSFRSCKAERIEGVKAGATMHFTSKPSRRAPRTMSRSSSAPRCVRQWYVSSGFTPNCCTIWSMTKPSHDAPSLGCPSKSRCVARLSSACSNPESRMKILGAFT